MPPVDTRVPPTSASSATTTTADEPSEVPKAALVGVVESALRQVVEVPIPSIVDARFPPVSASAANSATTSNTAEDRPCEAPLATIIFADKVAPLQVGDVPALLDHYGSSKDRTVVLCFSMEQQPPSELESQGALLMWTQRAISGTSSTVRPERRSQRQRRPPAWMALYMLEPSSSPSSTTLAPVLPFRPTPSTPTSPSLEPSPSPTSTTSAPWLPLTTATTTLTNYSILFCPFPISTTGLQPSP